MMNIKKVIYFILSIILLILMSLITLNHLNNKIYVNGENEQKELPKNIKTIKDEETNIELSYEISDEILETDIIKIRNKKLTKKLIKKDVVKYFSISLYDSNETKKTIKNSLMTVTVKLDEDLKKYDELKVVRINNKIEITDEEFYVVQNDNELIFDITRSSKYGIIGINYDIKK